MANIDRADAGLFPLDLPEANDPNVFSPGCKGWLPGGPSGPSVWTAPDGTVMVQRIEPGNLTPGEAREVAYAMLAAADHSEGVTHTYYIAASRCRLCGGGVLTA